MDKEDTEINYLQPHLLTKGTLIHLLERRCMNIKNLNTMSKEQLVDVFERVALPLPQRKYRDNRRGKLMIKLRKEQELNRNKSEQKPSGMTVAFGESTVQSIVSFGVGDRLKPPPDAVNYERKKIRLSNSSSSSSSSSSSNSKSRELDHIQIKKRRMEDKNGLLEGKRETERDHRKKVSSLEEKANGSQKVILKRSHSASTKVSASESVPEKKKEKKLITWP